MKNQSSIVVNRNFTIDNVDPRIFSGFIEHLGRAVYEGIYQPEHSSADDDGLRRDVIELVKALDMPLTRYPGGNFVSGYNWEDGVGPKDERPVRLDLAWKAYETNQFGTNEFMDWCPKAGTAPMLAVNLGTRGPAEAQALVEYCNHPAGSYWSDLRRSHGWEKPHNVKIWCLGNEMDGPWQTGHKTADEYGKVALEAAKMMKWTDPSIELVVCGSSTHQMPTFGLWETEVLNHTYDLVDYLSLHTYYNNHSDCTPAFLAMADRLDKYIKDAIAVCDYVGAIKKSDKRIMLSLDEWNVWFHSNEPDKSIPEWIFPRPILQDIYTMEDALLVGGMLITLLNHADRVKIACIAQTVNVIAPIMTAKDGSAWRQTIFFPFEHASRYGRGTVLQQVIESPEYDVEFRQNKDRAVEHICNVKYLLSSVVYRKEAGEITVFAVNRHLTEEMELTASLEGFDIEAVIEWQTMHHTDLKAVNSEGNERVCPISLLDGINIDNGIVSAALPPASWNMIRLKVV